MNEYKDNEAYEKDKARVIDVLEQHINDTFNVDAVDIVDTLNLLKQSKWVGIYPTSESKRRYL